MNVEKIRDHCLGKKGVEECFPFDNETLVFKVMDKMFLLISLEGDLSLNVKCDPEKAIELREKYPAVQPGYHMNKKHWNTIMIDGSVSSNMIFEWIDNSYSLVADKLPVKKRQQLDQL